MMIPQLILQINQIDNLEMVIAFHILKSRNAFIMIRFLTLFVITMSPICLAFYNFD